MLQISKPGAGAILPSQEGLRETHVKKWAAKETTGHERNGGRRRIQNGRTKPHASDGRMLHPSWHGQAAGVFVFMSCLLLFVVRPGGSRTLLKCSHRQMLWFHHSQMNAKAIRHLNSEAVPFQHRAALQRAAALERPGEKPEADYEAMDSLRRSEARVDALAGLTRIGSWTPQDPVVPKPQKMT